MALDICFVVRHRLVSADTLDRRLDRVFACHMTLLSIEACGDTFISQARWLITYVLNLQCFNNLLFVVFTFIFWGKSSENKGISSNLTLKFDIKFI